MQETYDFIVIGAGSAGCAVAAGLADAGIGSVAILESGPTNRVPQVKVPFGLLFTMGSRSRDWRMTSTKQTSAGDREFQIPRGKMLGGSSSINSMVWFRGRRDDFDTWNVNGWRWADIAGDFQEIEARMTPQRLPDPHPLSEGFARALKDNGEAPPTPERESAGIFHTNMRNGARWSSADAFLRPAQRSGRLHVITNSSVDRIAFDGKTARGVNLIHGRVLKAKRGIVVSAGSIGSPSILMRSGIGPAKHLRSLGIDVITNSVNVGHNLHDHPAAGVHHVGENSGYGLVLSQLPQWVWSPFNWLTSRRGRMTSNFVEAGAFFRAMPVGKNGDDRPDCQVHFIPYMMGYQGKTIVYGSGYFADVCVCRPLSRGSLKLQSKDPLIAPNIDLGIFNNSEDLEVLTAGFKRLRQVLAAAPFGERKAPEVFPAEAVQSDDEIRHHIRERSGTTYHPVGTLRMGEDKRAPVDPGLAVRGVENLWVADASIMPAVTSANTNAPSIMIGHRAAKLIINEVKTERRAA